VLQSGRVAFGAMETVAFGKPAAQTVAEEARRRDAELVFLMVSGTLSRTPTRSPRCAARSATGLPACSTICHRTPRAMR
jgi:hypothetical protein